MGSTMQDCSQADIVFLIEATAMNGAYINDLKSNYVVPTLEYFSQGPIEDKEYFESTNALYGLVTYRSGDCLLQPTSKCYGPYTNPHRFLYMFEHVSQKMSGGRGESHAHIAEGFATALQYFEDLVQKRETGATPQKHCILVCNSPPYSMPVMESHTYSGHTAENLASELVQRGIHLSVVSPRKIPALFKLYEKAGGDLQTSQTKNYAKDPRHLVLLKGFSLKERPVSPCGGTGVGTLGTAHPPLPLQSMPSPSTNIGSPMTPSSTQQNVVPPQTAVVPPFRAGQQNPPGLIVNQPPMPNPAQSQPQPQVPQQAPQIVSGMGGPRMMQNFNPPYMQPGARPMGRWPPMMGPGPQQRPPMVFNPQQSPQQQQQQQQQQQGSALIAQLTQPPSSMAPQFQRMDNSSVMSGNMNQGVPQQQPTLRMMVQQQPGPGGPVPGIGPGPGPLVGPGPPTGIVQPQIQQGMPPNPQQTGRERHTIWHGMVEWIEKAKIDSQKITRNVPCTVTAQSKDGEPELKADTWPPKLIMQLMPKQLIGNIGGSCLKNSKSVLFHPQPCEALDSLTKVMSSGFAGCVHFTSVPSPAACDIKVLILLYTTEKRAYLGFIPNDQAAFVDRLRKVIQQQKTSQALMRQAQGGQPGPGPSPGGLEPMPGQQPGMMGHPMRPGLPGPMQPGMMGPQQPPNMGDPNVSQTGGMMNPIGPNQQSNANSVMSAAPPLATTATGQQPPTNTISMQGAGPRGPGMMGQRPPFNDQIEAARQQNLAKIHQLRQTLEAAQRQEMQYVEIMSHMPVKQIEQNLEHAQMQEMQYKSQLEEQQKQQMRVQLQQQMQQSVGMGPRPPQQQGGGPQPPQSQPPGGVPQQPGGVNQRMMRPLLANNSPGLRHLLQQQQQPQYRQQVMGMQPPIQQGMAQQRAQQVLQNPGGPGGQQQPGGQQFDDVPNFDFLS